ncbi:Retrovirus-related Pol polyprotein from transposon 297 [Eumeta japonica]|uniref:Retrovirus-related Pol polyprotein from transposon 297 n=1 Tax=Eumeta variegata TaxID=151549 RepID=A0A4C1U6X7_EUMVA|nr:Retrovirus-related Pol polyprotein from transposon 297 [Eumeta japonica]
MIGVATYAYVFASPQHSSCAAPMPNDLKEHGITTNLPKCNLGQPEVKFLGYIVSKEGIKPPAEKVKPIMDYPEPQTDVECCGEAMKCAMRLSVV